MKTKSSYDRHRRGASTMSAAAAVGVADRSVLRKDMKLVYLLFETAIHIKE